MRHYTLPKFLARMARTFGKVYKSDNQSLLEYVMYGRFANAPSRKTFRTAPFLCVTNLLPFTSYLLPENSVSLPQKCNTLSNGNSPQSILQ